MPKTRLHEPRDQKAAAILEVAQRQLREGGYPALSVAAIGRELEVAQNTIYWYFPSKDDLFVAALSSMLEQIHTRKPSKKAGKLEQILWYTDQFEELSGLRAAMTERARSSAVVAEFVQELDALLSRMLSGALAEDVPADELPLAVETFRSTVEGTFVKGLDRRERRRVLTYALQRLIVCVVAVLVAGCGGSGGKGTSATASHAAGCGSGGRLAAAPPPSGGSVDLATVESRLTSAGYAVKPVPKSYGIYVQVAPDGRQYRVDGVLDIGCPDGTDLYASVFVIRNAANRQAYLKTSVDPKDAQGSTVVRGDRVYAISAGHGESDKVKILNTIVTIAETGKSPG